MKRMVIIACVAVAGCAAELKKPTTTVVQRLTLNATQIATIQKGAVEGLKDPGSAQLDGVQANLLSDGSVYVCGKYNAKNSYGAYAGFSPFRGRANKDVTYFTLEGRGDTSDGFVDLVRIACENNGLYL